MSYSLQSYGEMIADNRRIEPYAAALKKALKPGMTVLDLGAGAGILSLIAANLGARKVHAVEYNPIASTLTETARVNGYEDIIEVHEKSSFEVELKERVDIIISSIHGIVPFFGRYIPTLIDARERLLRSGGIFLPKADRVYGALIESFDTEKELFSNFRSSDFNFKNLEKLQKNRTHRLPDNAKISLLSEPLEIATLDHKSLNNPDLKASFEFAHAKPGILHGLMLWNEVILTDEIRITESPDSKLLSYGQLFIPAAETPVIKEGESTTVNLDLRVIGERYRWSWSFVSSNADQSLSDKVVKQSTFLGDFISGDKLKAEKTLAQSHSREPN